MEVGVVMAAVVVGAPMVVVGVAAQVIVLPFIETGFNWI